MRKLLLVIITLSIVSILTNCNCDDYKYFRIVGISADIDEREIGYDTATNLIIKEYSIQLDYSRMYYSINQPYKFNLINSAYATAKCPGDGYEGCKELINHLNVYCSSNYDSIHSANDTINSLFSFYGEAAIYNFDTLPINLADFKDYKIYSPYDYITLTLLQKPTLDQLQEFTVEFIMSDGEVLTTKTQKIKID